MAIVEVRDLRISFWTNNGTVKAVRGISFDVEEGQTLAIVGESGSGKSVTAKAMLGILAGNAIIEGGEIYFDGKDLLKVPEEVFHQIRGNNIAMIFQDPLSSLNPIVRVGKQLTEAMIANNHAARRDSKINYGNIMKSLAENMEGSGISSGETKSTMDKFAKIIREGNELEHEYDNAHDMLETTVSNIEGVKIDIIDKLPRDVVVKVKDIMKHSEQAQNRFLIPKDDSDFAKIIENVKNTMEQYRSTKGEQSTKDALTKALDDLKNDIVSALERPRPRFMAMGYYALENGRDSLNNKKIADLNADAVELMNTSFITDFSAQVSKAIEYADKAAHEKRKLALNHLNESLKTLEGEFKPADIEKLAGESKKLVDEAINKLDTDKNSVAYTYENALDNAIRIFKLTFKSEDYNEKKKAKVRKKDRLPERLDLDILRDNIRLVLRRVKESFEEKDKLGLTANYDEKAVSLIKYIDNESSKMDYKISKALAKTRAIDLMEEVGIPQARLRYRQYPFEFSGGMRQRIVIAIALASNPDVLICDEPTTALDVTIQAQILDLINELKHKRKLSIIFITHDLGVVANMADTIAVMYAGKIVELGSADEVFYKSAHPYTWALLSSMPDLDTKEKLEFIPGVPPNMIYPPVGDAFAGRNKYALEIDFEEQPPMFEITPTHFAATWLLHPDAPKVDPPKMITDRIRRMHEKWGGILDEQ